jgi:hypothetical protein
MIITEPEIEWIPVDQHPIAEAAHRRIRGLARVEGSDAPILDEHVVECDHELAMRRRPVIGIRRDDKDVPVRARLLAVVLPDVRVVASCRLPLHTGATSDARRDASSVSRMLSGDVERWRGRGRGALGRLRDGCGDDPGRMQT